MAIEPLFRWVFLLVFLSTLLISAYYRGRARRSGEVIPRAREGKSKFFARLLVAAPLYLSFMAYILNPRWMEWSALELPAWLRWLAVTVSVGMLPLLLWVLTSIGKNISETFLTKEHHELVTTGPYRRVRHPLYAVATVVLISLSIVAANWFMLAMAIVALMAISKFVIPREESELLRKFGGRYLEYERRTGRFTPRLTSRD